MAWKLGRARMMVAAIRRGRGMGDVRMKGRPGRSSSFLKKRTKKLLLV
jgi:hypothetical protein